MKSFAIPFVDPIQAFAPFAAEPWAMLLDSAAPQAKRGRYSYMAVRPFQTLITKADQTWLDGRAVAGDPFTLLAQTLAPFAVYPGETPVPFIGGAVGFLGYELGRFLEHTPARFRVPSAQPDMAFGLYDVVVAFDLEQRLAWVLSARPEADDKAETLAARLLQDAVNPLPPLATFDLSWRPEIARADYQAKVQQVIDYILAGDIFQANMTQRFLAPRPQGFVPFEAYRCLRAANPAPFAAFLNIEDDFALLSASPERFLSLYADGAIETRPIKGTRARSACAEDDVAAAQALAVSIKDRAENLMITDVLRNDIGRVSLIGSVKVPKLAGVESYASLHHLVSVVQGRLKPGLGPVELLRACFPGGSITGAPKVRAMEIIDELEVAPRGPYCGSIAWIGFDGAMDSNIVIRTVVATADQIITQAGGGIVSDSDPAAEHAEMLAKARPALRALSQGDEPCWSG